MRIPWWVSAVGLMFWKVLRSVYFLMFSLTTHIHSGEAYLHSEKVPCVVYLWMCWLSTHMTHACQCVGSPHTCRECVGSPHTWHMLTTHMTHAYHTHDTCSPHTWHMLTTHMTHAHHTHDTCSVVRLTFWKSTLYSDFFMPQTLCSKWIGALTFQTCVKLINRLK
jgi:hypothetical protein